MLALRLANADLLPFDFAAYARHLRTFVVDLEKATEKERLDSRGCARASTTSRRRAAA